MVDVRAWPIVLAVCAFGCGEPTTPDSAATPLTTTTTTVELVVAASDGGGECSEIHIPPIYAESGADRGCAFVEEIDRMHAEDKAARVVDLDTRSDTIGHLFPDLAGFFPIRLTSQPGFIGSMLDCGHLVANLGDEDPDPAREAACDEFFAEHDFLIRIEDLRARHDAQHDLVPPTTLVSSPAIDWACRITTEDVQPVLVAGAEQVDLTQFHDIVRGDQLGSGLVQVRTYTFPTERDALEARDATAIAFHLAEITDLTHIGQLPDRAHSAIYRTNPAPPTPPSASEYITVWPTGRQVIAILTLPGNTPNSTPIDIADLSEEIIGTMTHPHERRTSRTCLVEDPAE